MNALLTSRLDYDNALLYGITKHLTDKLLPVEYRIEYPLGVLHGLVPVYLKPYVSSRSTGTTTRTKRIW